MVNPFARAEARPPDRRYTKYPRRLGAWRLNGVSHNATRRGRYGYFAYGLVYRSEVKSHIGSESFVFINELLNCNKQYLCDMKIAGVQNLLRIEFSFKDARIELIASERNDVETR